MNNIEITKLKALVCIINKGDERDLVRVLEENGARGITDFSAKGAASLEILQMLKLSDGLKYVVICLIRAEDEPKIKEALSNEVYSKPGKGLALVVRVDGFIGAKKLFRLYDIEHSEDSVQ